jgi:Protein of unknown function (DUF998)
MTRSARALAWFAIAAQILFVAAWIVAGALEDGYSHSEQAISELGADGAAHPLVMNAAIVVLGLSIAGLAPALLAVLPRRRAARVAAALFLTMGLAVVVAGVLNLDCSTAVSDTCQERWDAHDFSWQHSAHLWASLWPLLVVLTPFALARALWGRPVAAPALACGLIGVGMAVGFTVLFALGGEDADGLVQRLQFVPFHVWLAIVATGILHSARPAAELPPPTELPPRQFFAGSWTGEGTLVPWPHWIWKRFPQRFAASRKSTFASDELWYVDDRAWLADGTVVAERRLFCTLEGGDRVHVTSDPLLDGADIVLREGGYRLAPYRVAVPVGPLHFGLTVRDHGALEPGGEFVNRLRISWFGLPVARVEIRARPEG